MRFSEIVDQASELLRRTGRVSYRALTRDFELDDDTLEDLKEELIAIRAVAVDKDGKMLVWTGAAAAQEPEHRPEEAAPQHPPTTATVQTDNRADAERRQLTVMFCDLVGSTTLSEQLDPEEYHEVVRRYQESCTTVIKRYAGHIAQHLGDGLLVYFGYPMAHEDDAQRAVRTGLEILATLSSLNAQLPSALMARLPHPLQVRIGVHTGVVVIGEIGSSETREILAMGETPNIAARVQGMTEPDTVVMSAATQRLVHGLFECQDLGPQTLKGISTPLALYRIIGESAAQSRFDVAVGAGLTPLVGREEELGLLQRRWTHVKDGVGHVVLLSGEPGIGKSRLVQELKEQVSAEGAIRIEFRCSPYHQNSALYPIIEHLHRLLQFDREDSPAAKLEKLHHTLSHYRFPHAETVPLLATLLSLPHPEGYPIITVSPQKQKQQTHAAIVAWLIEEAEQKTVYTTWEDVHWADPSSLEVLNLVVDQAPTARLYVLVTFRPEFSPPWGNRSHISQITLSRLAHAQTGDMVKRATGGKPLPAEVVQQIVAKTDGVPLFVEELTKTVVESGLLTDVNDRYELSGPLPPLAIPPTLHASLLARLDRLSTVREIAQLGATIGREFSYELLAAVSPLDEAILQHGLKQIVESELVYQRGVVPHAHYLFKHALIQDTAYQSLLKSTRQQYHLQIAQVLEAQFPETVETQPELVAHHYTEAGLIPQAIPYWQEAGHRAVARSANVEAIRLFTAALELLNTLPDTPERAQQELRLRIALGAVQIATRGYASPEARRTFTRARELSTQMGDVSHHFPALVGIATAYLVAGETNTAHQHAAQLLSLAHRQQDAALLAPAHCTFGVVSFWLGEQSVAREHLEQAIALYDPTRDNPYASGVAQDHGVISRSFVALALWVLGYPEQALKRTQEALSLARELAHPYSLAFALGFAARLHQLRRERQRTREQAEATIALCTDRGIPFFLALGTVLQGWALTEGRQTEERIAQIRQGLAGWQATGAEVSTPLYLALLGETYGLGGQTGEGLAVVGQGLAIANKNEERFYEAELYRLKGELMLQSPVHGSQFSMQQEAEACFLKAIAVAQKQHAKSWELRAVTSLARLWQQQGKKAEAYDVLSSIYNWFTEGFDTQDLREAKALLA
ncbi:MAG: adenylate/guanylate cyclase domain-containing protein [Candidatus Binatia bacterium]